MKLLINQLVARATADVNRAQMEARLPEQFRTIQEAFKNDALLAGQEGLASLCFAITGFRPRTTNQKILPFEVFEVMSKAEQRVTKTALCMSSVGGVAYGCSGLAEAYVQYSPDTCRIAEEEAAKKFIASEVASWEDGAVISWLTRNLGSTAPTQFIADLERNIAGIVAKK